MKEDIITRYHKRCFQLFSLGKPPPSTEKREKGRPIDEGMQHWFEVLCIWLEVQTRNSIP